MDYIVIPPDEINEIEVELPLSKSISNRVLIISALTGNPKPLPTLSKCDDTDVMTEALTGNASDINVGAAGTAMRFLTAYFAQKEDAKDVIIDGTERMRERPIAPLVDALVKCGADIEYLGEQGFPPLKISGSKLIGGELTVNASMSSQFISALMMIAPKMEKGLTLHLEGAVVSTPYIVVTQKLMEEAGVNVDFYGGNTVVVEKGEYKPTDFSVDADWSAAAFWMELSALSSSEFDLKGLKVSSYQGDVEAVKFFETLGLVSRATETGIHIEPSPEMYARLNLDLTDNPDLAQPLAVTACLLGIPFRFSGLSTLKNKETDRLNAIASELYKISFDLSVDDNSLSWDGGRHPVYDNEIIFDTYNDHRMAMALVPVSIFVPGIVIKNVEVVNKSYPDYWRHLSTTGFRLVDYAEALNQNIELGNNDDEEDNQ